MAYTTSVLVPKGPLVHVLRTLQLAFLETLCHRIHSGPRPTRVLSIDHLLYYGDETLQDRARGQFSTYSRTHSSTWRVRVR